MGSKHIKSSKQHFFQMRHAKQPANFLTDSFDYTMGEQLTYSGENEKVKTARFVQLLPWHGNQTMGYG